MASVAKRTWTHKGARREAWVVRFVDDTGAHRSKQYDRKKDADAYRLQVENDLEEGTIGARTRLTVAALCDQALASQEVRLQDGRIGQGRFIAYKLAFERDVKPYFKQKKLAELTPEDVQSFYNWMITDRKLAKSTLKNRFSVFLGLLWMARSRGYIRKDIVAPVSRDLRGGGFKSPPRVLSEGEVRAILAEAEKRVPGGQRHAHLLRLCAFNLATFCGLRFGEITGLTAHDIEFDGACIQVRHNLTHWNELKSPKTASGRRAVPLPAHVAALLRDWMAKHYTTNDRNLVFLSQAGTTVSPSDFHNGYWHPVLKRLGLFDQDGGNHPHFHALRHFYGSWLIRNGVPIPTVSKLMGHSRPELTMRIYAHDLTLETHRHDMVAQAATLLLTNGSAHTDCARDTQQPLSP